MTIFSFATAQEIRFGRGCAEQEIAVVSRYGSKVFVVHGANADRSDWLVNRLNDQSLTVQRFKCASEPDVDIIEAGVNAARAHRAQVVISLGGGAVIDAGKAIAALVPAQRPMMDHLEVVGRGLALEDDPLPFIAIPTTAGTGAEVTKNSVISVAEHRRKVSLRDVRMLPDLALVDPALTDDTPRGITLASGLDAVTQVIEPYLSNKANRLTDALCRDAILQGMQALVRLMRHEDSAARDDMAWVSLCGGLALANSGLGAVHGLAGVIGGLCGAPHGAICGALLPHVLQANAAQADMDARTAARIAEVQGWIATGLKVAVPDAFGALAEWSRAQGLPRLADMGLSRQDHEAVAMSSVASSSMKGNPVPLSVAELQVILNAS